MGTGTRQGSRRTEPASHRTDHPMEPHPTGDPAAWEPETVRDPVEDPAKGAVGDAAWEVDASRELLWAPDPVREAKWELDPVREREPAWEPVGDTRPAPDDGTASAAPSHPAPDHAPDPDPDPDPDPADERPPAPDPRTHPHLEGDPTP